MQKNVKKIACIAVVAFACSTHARASGSAAIESLYSSPPKVEKAQAPQPDFGITTSDKTKKAFIVLAEENTKLWIRDAQSTALYRGLRNEILSLRAVIAEMRRNPGAEQLNEYLRAKDAEIRMLAEKNERLAEKLNEHSVLTGRYEQLKETYKELVTSIESATNRTTKTNLGLAELMARKNQEAAKKAAENDSDMSDDE
ncbi:MAG: hypothetical protein HEEMFOPI_01315 [Holosporales bacterium]